MPLRGWRSTRTPIVRPSPGRSGNEVGPALSTRLAVARAAAEWSTTGSPDRSWVIGTTETRTDTARLESLRSVMGGSVWPGRTAASIRDGATTRPPAAALASTHAGPAVNVHANPVRTTVARSINAVRGGQGWRLGGPRGVLR